MKSKVINKYSIIAILGIIFDQISKFIISQNGIEANFNDLIGIEISVNTGMVFGFKYGNIKNLIISFAVLLIIFGFVKNQKERLNNITKLALAFVISGATSNIIDRIFRGGVLEFIKIFKLPLFNFADLFLIIGWLLLVIFIWKQNRIENDVGEDAN